MHFLKKDEVFESNEVEYKGIRIKLISPINEGTTFIEDSFESEIGDEIDYDSKVYMRQRWRVEILPTNRLQDSFTTARYIEFYYCTYGELVEDQEKDYSSPDSKKSVDTNELGDSFLGY